MASSNVSRQTKARMAKHLRGHFTWDGAHVVLTTTTPPPWEADESGRPLLRGATRPRRWLVPKSAKDAAEIVERQYLNPQGGFGGAEKIHRLLQNTYLRRGPEGEWQIPPRDRGGGNRRSCGDTARRMPTRT